jgi:cell division ATP-binding protein FtsE
MAFVEFRDVTKIYQTGTKALSNVSFSIEEGDFVFFIGESGAGKSTIFKLLTCEERPTSGVVLLDNFNVGQIKDRQIPFLRRKIGMVFQDFRLIDSLTVGENVAFAMEIIGEPRKKIRQRVPIVLAVVGLRNKINDYPSELSEGEKQRVSIARALVNRPHLIIADEPTGDLDPVNGESIMALLERINRNNGTTIITCSHDSAIINKMNKRVLEVKDGVLIRDDACGKYFRRDERFGYYVPDHETASKPEQSDEKWAEGDHAMELLRRVDQQEREERRKRLDSKTRRRTVDLQGEGFFEELRRSQSERRGRPGTRERRELLKKRLEETGSHEPMDVETMRHDMHVLRDTMLNKESSAEETKAEELSVEIANGDNVESRVESPVHSPNVVRKRLEHKGVDEHPEDPS